MKTKTQQSLPAITASLKGALKSLKPIKEQDYRKYLEVRHCEERSDETIQKR